MFYHVNDDDNNDDHGEEDEDGIENGNGGPIVTEKKQIGGYSIIWTC